MHRTSHLLRALGLAALAVACRTTPKNVEEPKLVAPPLEVVLGHAAGSFLGERSTRSVDALDAAPEHALRSHWRVYYLERDPGSSFEALVAHARLFANERGDDPINSTSELATRITFARGEQASEFEARIRAKEFGRFALLADSTSALSVGMTGFVGVHSKSRDAEVTVEAWRAKEDELRAAVAIEDLPPPALADPRETAQEAEERAKSATASKPRGPRRESIVLDQPFASDGRPIAFLWPSPPDLGWGGEGEAFAVIVSYETAPTDVDALKEHGEKLAAAIADCKSAASDASIRGARIENTESRRRELESALGSLAASDHRRASLVFLTDATGAELAGDLALAADDATLDSFVKSLPSETGQIAKLAADGTTLGFVLEKCAYAFLAARSNEAPLAAELAGALLRRSGEVGRSAGAIDDLVAASRDLASLHTHLVDENRIALEDSNVGVRVRAFDWLAARNLAPVGFDPLGNLKDRRAALERAEVAESSAEKKPR